MASPSLMLSNATMAMAVAELATHVRLVHPGQPVQPQASKGGVFPLIVCYSPSMMTTTGIFQKGNLLDYSPPLFLLQSIVVIALTRGLHYVFRRLRQPTFVAEVIGGIILGPSVMGRIIPEYMHFLFPLRSVSLMDSFANLGLLYFIFVVGLQIDLSSVSRADKRAWVLTAAGVLLPFSVETLFFLAFGSSIQIYRNNRLTDSYHVFVGVSISITAYPVLVRILAELKLLHTETGRLAMSSALLNDGLSWVLLGLAVALTGREDSSLQAAFETVVSGVLLVVFIYCTVRPGARLIESRIKEGQALDEIYVVMVLVVVMACGVAGDAIGIHALFGAFTMGVVMPNGPLASIMVEKLEDFVSGFMMPLYFAVIGNKAEVASLRNPALYAFLTGTIVLSSLARLGATLLISMFYAMSLREGLTLGIVANTKGIMDLIVLHVAFDKRVLDTQSYTILLFSSVALTTLVTPLARVSYRPARDYFAAYKRRMIHKSRPDAELRMVACIHTTRQVPSIIALLELSHPTKRSPVFVYALHLVELSGRESAMLIVHDTQQESSQKKRGFIGGGGGGGAAAGNMKRVQVQSDQIIKGFQTYEQRAGGVSVQPMTVASAYSTMHEDVCNVAEDKHAAFLILPFHKQHTVDGGMEVINPGIWTLNQNVVANAPCSVGILVDRGLGGSAARAIGGPAHSVALIFIGGPDDREALSFAARMADHPGISLTVIRMVDASEESKEAGGGGEEEEEEEDRALHYGMSDREKERMMDDECVKDFRIRTMSEETVAYVEKRVRSGVETVTAIRAIETVHDLYIVGRGEGVDSPLTAGLTDWAEHPELGAIGDLLLSSDLMSTVSLLVVQQYRTATGGGPASPGAGEGAELGFGEAAGGGGGSQYLGRGSTSVRDRSMGGWG